MDFFSKFYSVTVTIYFDNKIINIRGHRCELLQKAQ
jgi:hypothetical protein